MTNSGNDEWPSEQDTIAPAAHLQALGQITLVFNYLEESIGGVFKETMPTNITFSERLYHKLNNRDRIDLLTAIIQESEKEADIKDALLHLLNCYEICSENRNILLHAILESADADILNLSKKAARNPERGIELRIPLADLRLVADQMGRTFVYAMRLQSTIDARSRPTGGLIPTAFDVDGPIEDFIVLPEKPPKPRPLIPYQPPATLKDAEFPSSII